MTYQMKVMLKDLRRLAMSNNGWIKIHRQILNWEWYSEPNTFRLFFHLLLKANHKPKKYRGVLIKDGQVMTGQELLGKELSLTRSKIRVALNNLVLTNEITIKSSKQGTIIQIVKYKSYQVTTNESTTSQPLDDQAITINKNVKKEKEEYWAKFSTWIKDNQLNKDKVYAQFDKAWFYYEQLEWVNSKGKEVKDPLMTIRNNWFKDLGEYKLSRREINDLKPALTTIYTDGR